MACRRAGEILREHFSWSLGVGRVLGSLALVAGFLDFSENCLMLFLLEATVSDLAARATGGAAATKFVFAALALTFVMATLLTTGEGLGRPERDPAP